MKPADDKVNILVINDKDDDLCNGDEEVCKVSNGVILIVHSWEVHHVKTLNMFIQVVHEGNSCPFCLCCPSGNLIMRHGGCDSYCNQK